MRKKVLVNLILKECTVSKKESVSSLPNNPVQMDGRKGTGSDGEKTNLTKRYKKQEIMKSYDHPRPEQTRYLVEEESIIKDLNEINFT